MFSYIVNECFYVWCICLYLHQPVTHSAVCITVSTTKKQLWNLITVSMKNIYSWIIKEETQNKKQKKIGSKHWMATMCGVWVKTLDEYHSIYRLLYNSNNPYTNKHDRMLNVLLFLFVYFLMIFSNTYSCVYICLYHYMIVFIVSFMNVCMLCMYTTTKKKRNNE